MDFEIFKSQVCHDLKRHGDLEYMKHILLEHMVENYWNQEEYAKSLYLVALFDYLAYIHEKPIFVPFNYYREQKLKELAYPLDVVFMDALGDKIIKEKILKECREDDCGKFFLRHNIVERDIRNVI